MTGDESSIQMTKTRRRKVPDECLTFDQHELPFGITVAFFETWVGSGAFADGIIGRLRRRDCEVSCFFKVVRAETFDYWRYPLRGFHMDRGLDFPCTPATAMSKLMAEARLFYELGDIDVAPRPYGLWMAANKLGSGMIDFIAMQKCEIETERHEFDDTDK